MACGGELREGCGAVGRVPPVTTPHLTAIPASVRRTASRPRAALAAGLARSAVAAAAVGSVAALAGCGSGANVDWAVVESGPKGDTIVVVPLIALRSCDEAPQPDVRKSNANEVELGITVKQGSCDDEDARPAAPLAVKLNQPLRGQVISGPGLKPPSANPAAKPGAAVPSIVGFRLPDARAILEARAIDLEVTTGPTADATEVTSQSPQRGATGAQAGNRGAASTPVVSVRTVPR